MPSSILRVAAVQMLPALGDPPANLERADRLAAAICPDPRRALYSLCREGGRINPRPTPARAPAQITGHGGQIALLTALDDAFPQAAK